MNTAALDRGRVCDNHSAADLLLTRGADVNARGQNGETLLHFASIFGCVDVLQLALDRGAEIDARNQNQRTPLLCALRFEDDRVFENKATAEILLARGADINATDEWGRSLLHVAAEWGCVKVLQLALDRGADVSITSPSGTALHHAVWRCRNAEGNPLDFDEQKKLRAAQMLVAHGIDVNAVGQDGHTAVRYAEQEFPEDSPIRAYLTDLHAQRADPE
uniref:Uncharacterized protein n=1 Tax=Chromera velia CCMP2878 TaxID=1169474 RepID=A0A0G4F6C2_9ALVE|eukprot:Cvel_15362.t1-p1 / transcript=Cvel_15362.t1 / gene=Cvel_15362 / organism=Chromera_velia_CCMP2878 / gene_product=Putative ankyrin repeat protein RF_0381, putative / transcript_product=Putative ankyrin repeat protein RF_0381, putative / location=Cvel_scaffold1132:13835-14488(-) / protein_length=218 / sequence_SO=supercontig / SO=protein_coding / is_pseudo=false